MKKFKNVTIVISGLILFGCCFGCKTNSNSSSSPEYKATYIFTETPVLLKDYIGSEGESNQKVRYYKFGDFPQTIKANDVQISEVPAANGYYIGNDGNYYAKVEEDGFNISVANGVEYSNGERVAEKSLRPNVLFFKVEPIIWCAFTDDYDHDGDSKTPGQTLLVSEKILSGDIPYYELSANRIINEFTILPNNYRYSTLRAYLNGKYESDDTQVNRYKNKGFLQIAFTKKAQKLISVTTVDNSLKSTSFDGSKGLARYYDCENTKDKVFAMGQYEMSIAGQFGFSKYDVRDKRRIRYSTDYAKATNSNQSSNEDEGGWWWLRSPNYIHSVCARYVHGSGETNFASVYLSSGGVVPVLCIDLNK